MSQDQDQQGRRKVTDFCRQAPRRHPFATGALGLIILILIIWFLPYWQVPKSGLSLKDRLHQINENRKTVAQIVGGVFILWGLYIAWVRSEAARKMAEVNREQQLTDLYVKAVEQLGSENLQMRLGGIYALERIARESAKDHWPIMEVLTAFVRENAPLKKEMPAERIAEEESSANLGSTVKSKHGTPLSSPLLKPPSDIQAVLTVLGRTAINYAQKGETRFLDLEETNLMYADLMKANLHYVLLTEANLDMANLEEANLKGARLHGASLQGTHLVEANLQEADLDSADLHHAYLYHTNLQGADLSGANLQKTFLGANLHGANFQISDIRGAELTYAEGLDPEQMSETIWDDTTIWPDGFSPLPPRKKEKV